MARRPRRWAWLDGRVGFLALLLALAVAFQALVAPAVTAPRARTPSWGWPSSAGGPCGTSSP